MDVMEAGPARPQIVMIAFARQADHFDNMTSRPSIPDPVARALRREAGFGCCECGNPILQYHHIVPWSQEQHFRAEDMMVLCPLHHDKATKGALDIDEQRRLKSSPHNIRRGLAKGLMEVKQDYCAADLGSLLMVGDGTALRIGDLDILGLYLGDGNLDVSLRLYGQCDELLLHIERNVWITGDSLPWDLEADWQKLTLRERSRHINISIDARPRPLVVTGRFYAYGQEVRIDQNGLWLERTSSGISNLAIVGGMIEVDKSSGLMSFGPRVSGQPAYIVSEGDRSQRLLKAKNAWRKLRSVSSHTSSG